MKRLIEPYQVAACHHQIIPARVGGHFADNIKANLEHYSDLIDFCNDKFFSVSGPIRLITFGEFSITGLYWASNRGDRTFNNAEVIRHLAIRIPGEETEVLARKAREHGCYIAAANIEFDPEWPDYHFNCGFLINPAGRIVLKYRKITTSNQPVEFGCSPHDILDVYKNPLTGTFDPFPVVDTAIGRIAIMICGDLRAPEIPRVYSMKGADILLRLTSGYSDSMGGLFPEGIVESTLQVRAHDNALYVVNTNRGHEVGSIMPRARCGAGTMIADYQGNVLAKVQDSNEAVVRARIDVEAARQYRETYFLNPVTVLRSELFAPFFQRTIYPPNTFLKEGPIEELLDKRHRDLYAEAVTNMRAGYDFYPEDDARLVGAEAPKGPR